ncbi:hypothetical protein [Terrimonas alba]|uniref:hypothetical protein n=1 Tax=Terrimonas alba TaxID=3349636 RepID=UPI0035F48B79
MFETSDAIELWVIARLIVRRQEKVISAGQQEILDNWLRGPDRNKRFYEELKNPASLQKLIEGCRARRNILLGLN